jgi:hypothetical protein
LTDDDAKTKKKKRLESAPIWLAIPLIVAAFFAGSLLRWPGAATADASAARDPKAYEIELAADSYAEGHGFTVMAPDGKRRPTTAAPGAVLSAAVGHQLFGAGPHGSLSWQALLSSLAIALAAVAAWGAGGPIGGAAAAILLAGCASQIVATRLVSSVPAASLMVAACGALLIFGLAGEKPKLGAVIAAGITAGLGAAVDPLLSILAIGVLAGCLLRFSPLALAAGFGGILLGFGPLLVHRSVAFGNPLVTAERAAHHAPWDTGYFQGPAGTCLADWVGVDAASAIAYIDKDWIASQGAAANLVIVGIALTSIVAFMRYAGGRPALGFAAGIGAALLGLAAFAGRGFAIPAAPMASAFFVVIAIAGGAGLGALAGLMPLGTLLAVAGATSPVWLDTPRFLEAARMKPGFFYDRSLDELMNATIPGAASKAARATASSKPASAQARSDATQNGGPAVEKPATVPAVQKPKFEAPIPPHASWREATKTDVEKAKKSIAGEGGFTKPSVAIDDRMLVLMLKLEQKSLNSSAAEPDAVRMSLKILDDNNDLPGLRVRVLAADGKPLTNTVVSGFKARPFIKKLEDPFEARRLREWWPQMKE